MNWRMNNFAASLVLCCFSLNSMAQQQKQEFIEPVVGLSFSRTGAIVSGPSLLDIQSLQDILIKNGPFQHGRKFHFKFLAKFEGDDQLMELSCNAGSESAPDKKQLVRMLKEEENPKYSKHFTSLLDFYVKAQRNGVWIRFSGACNSTQFNEKLRELSVDSTNGYFDGIAFEVKRGTGIKFLF